MIRLIRLECDDPWASLSRSRDARMRGGSRPCSSSSPRPSIALGHALRQPSQMGANDISRWCTVWSLLERGTYIIDECPWQADTQDKVFRAPKGAIAPPGGQEPVRHYYSSKPALLPTLIAGILYPARLATGVPLDRVVLQARADAVDQKPDPSSPYGVKGVLETPKEPVRWPAYIFYFKPIVVLLNVIPFGILLVLYARVLDRHAANDWAWLFCLVAAAFGTYLLPFTQTLNNHTVAAFSAFFALYQLFWIWDREEPSGWRFAAAGFFAAFAAANELPALAFLVLLFGLLLVSFPRQTLLLFPAGQRLFRSRRSWPRSTLSSASSSWPTRRSAPTSTSMKEASGRRLWTWTRSTITPSRTRLISST